MIGEKLVSVLEIPTESVDSPRHCILTDHAGYIERLSSEFVGFERLESIPAGRRVPIPEHSEGRKITRVVSNGDMATLVCLDNGMSLEINIRYGSDPMDSCYSCVAFTPEQTLECFIDPVFGPMLKDVKIRGSVPG